MVCEVLDKSEMVGEIIGWFDVCPEMIEEPGPFRRVIFGISAQNPPPLPTS